MTASDRARIAIEARAFLAETLRAQLADAVSIVLDAVGSSMEPTVPGGSVMTVEPLDGAPLVGELLVFVPEHGVLLACHRVVALDADGRALTQGDRHTAPDGFCDPSRFVGRVRSFTLGGRRYDATDRSQPPPSRYRVTRARVARVLGRARVRFIASRASS